MTNRQKLSLLSVFALLTQGCASIFTGVRDEITFEANVTGATVYVDGIDIGEAPTTVRVKRKLSDRKARIEADGYKTEEFTLRAGFNGVTILNLFFWPGFIVDLATGSVKRFRTKRYIADLRANGGGYVVPAPVAVQTPRDAKDVGAAWMHLMGLSEQEVATIFGTPDSVMPSFNGGSIWVYGNGSVTFNKDGRVDGWQKPQ
jgi:hypothetical protein